MARPYEVRAGDIPVRDYDADLELTPAPEGGIAVTWRAHRFEQRWPLAPLIHRRLQAFIADTAGRLAIAAEDGDTYEVVVGFTMGADGERGGDASARGADRS